MKQETNDTTSLFFCRAVTGGGLHSRLLATSHSTESRIVPVFLLLSVERQGELSAKCPSIQGNTNFKQGLIQQKKEKTHLKDLGLDGLMNIEWTVTQSVQ